MPREANLLKQKVALQVLTGVVMTTRVGRPPLGTGRARGGWQVGLNTLDDVERGMVDRTGQRSINVGSTVIDAAKTGDDIVISNSVNYSKYLNDGTDKMAGDHMVERTVADVSAQFEG